MAVRSDARRLSGMRSAVSWLGFFYLVASALACMMLLVLNVPALDYWKTFYFWRFLLTPLNIVVGALLLQLAASACGCETRPSMVAIIVGLVHFVWCLVVVGFTVDDLFYCLVRPWCTVPPATKIDPFFVVWLVGFFFAALLEFIACIVAAMLYRAALSGCPSACTRRLRGGADYAGAEEPQIDGPSASVMSEMERAPVTYASTLGAGASAGGGIKLFSDDMLDALREKRSNADLVAGFKQS